MVNFDSAAALAEAELLHDRDSIERVIDDLAVALHARFGDEEPLFLVVMSGGLHFAARLSLAYPKPVRIDYCQVSRYREALTGGALQLVVAPSADLEGRSVVVVDDILDEGATLAFVVEWCRARGAREVLSAVLVRKERIAGPPMIDADFVGITVPDRFIVGYGMDAAGAWRNAPGIYALAEQTR